MIIWRFPKQMLEALNTLQRVEKIGVEFILMFEDWKLDFNVKMVPCKLLMLINNYATFCAQNYWVVYDFQQNDECINQIQNEE